MDSRTIITFLKQRSYARLIRIVIVAIVSVLLFAFVATPVKYKGRAMKPAIPNNTWVFMSKIYRLMEEPKRGDVVAIKVGGDFMRIARIVALPGETFEVRDSQVMIDGEAVKGLKFYHPEYGIIENYDPNTMSESEYFVLGDNLQLQMVELHSEGAFGRVNESKITKKMLFTLNW